MTWGTEYRLGWHRCQFCGVTTTEDVLDDMGDGTWICKNSTQCDSWSASVDAHQETCEVCKCQKPGAQQAR